MTTKLTITVARETTLQVNGRAVVVALIPANELTGSPDKIEFHLKGTQQRREIALAKCLPLVGWEQDVKRVPKAPTHSQQINELIDGIKQQVQQT